MRFEVSTDDLIHSRFAVSPLFELDQLLRKLSSASSHRLPASWSARLMPVYRRLRAETDLEAVLALQLPSYGPDFVAPPPHGLAQTIEDDLAAVRATPPRDARREIDHCLAARPGINAEPRAILRGEDAVERIAQALEAAWYGLLAADWPQLLAICERDVVHRAGQLSRAGWAAALNGLHSRLRWDRGGIEILRVSPGTSVTLGGRGLLLVPSVFTWPRLAAVIDRPWPATIIYPAQGSAALWETPAGASPASLGNLLGRTRARILAELAQSASTTQLARSLGIATGAAGDHLTVLTRAGLLTKARSGRSVLYRRSPLGDALVGACE
jgi:DNA-binding transcriptional ArsR family regulator